MPKVTIDRYLASDLILAVGTRLGEATTQGYTLPQSPHPRQPLIHAHDDARQLGRNYAAAHALIADPIAFLEALAERPGAASTTRGQWVTSLRDPLAFYSNFPWRRAAC